MKTFTKLGRAIQVEINEDYVVRANIRHYDNSNKYLYSYELMRKDVGKYDALIGDSMEIVTKNPNYDIANLILKANADGFFAKYIERYEYELKATEIGLDILMKGIKNNENTTSSTIQD